MSHIGIKRFIPVPIALFRSPNWRGLGQRNKVSWTMSRRLRDAKRSMGRELKGFVFMAFAPERLARTITVAVVKVHWCQNVLWCSGQFLMEELLEQCIETSNFIAHSQKYVFQWRKQYVYNLYSDELLFQGFYNPAKRYQLFRTRKDRKMTRVSPLMFQ